MSVRIRRFLIGLVAGFLVATLLADCGGGPSVHEERDPFHVRAICSPKGCVIAGVPLAGEPFPDWAVGRWRGEARDTSSDGPVWRVTADIRPEPGASMILYRHGGRRCSMRPRVITFNDSSLTFAESRDQCVGLRHGLGQTLVLNLSEAGERLEGVYLDFTTGRNIIHATVALSRVENQQ